MKKLILTAVVSVFSANALYAAGIPDADFAKSLNGIAAAAAETVKAGKSEPILPAKAEIVIKTGRYVQVSGYVNLNGNGFVPPNGGFTSVPLTGWGNFRDNSGKVTSNNTYINVYVSMWIYPNQYVFQTVWPHVYVQFYQDGKYIGSTGMTGSVSVSGFPSGSFVHLNGSGYLNGSIYVEDAQ
ncbi:MAG: hypothetical protein HY796_05820 [Elusimicrobia bacterium]|nr:hypothetical protein [Elusimicrobiota bacterium]